MDYAQKLNDLLLTTARQNASDLHIAVGRRPTLRVDGILVGLQNEPILNLNARWKLVMSMLSQEQKDKLLRYGDLDFSYAFEDKARFRVNVFFQRGFMAAALRLIPAVIKTAEELRLPPVVHDFAKLNQGFVLVVGPAGQGKSTTLAAILDEVNHSRMEHIITVEDPIEYLFVQDRSIVSQREISTDSPSFHRLLDHL
ncbi:MAG: Flp pilus assembly complex ATPase component TadA, partial [Patescibacteria group bacterium]|nr:Flp pilus assembly complex ATPase component TadA [Patescibacteria group bacterium]